MSTDRSPLPGAHHLADPEVRGAPVLLVQRVTDSDTVAAVVAQLAPTGHVWPSGLVQVDPEWLLWTVDAGGRTVESSVTVALDADLGAAADRFAR